MLLGTCGGDGSGSGFVSEEMRIGEVGREVLTLPWS